MAHIHILGICGTFMGGLACIARELGHRVTGSDQNVYPPMSDLLRKQGMELQSGYDAVQLDPPPDITIVGNALSRGNPAVEYLLNQQLPFASGAEWLRNEVLRTRHVLAVSGTHGKSTTSCMLAWILECAGLKPGFLIGGVGSNFGISARLGNAPYFVIEADEYDTAFFDKRSKFVHYHPRTLLINNIEFDHADIFDDIADIRRQFHHLVRIVPNSGNIVANARDKEIEKVLKQGCWTPVQGIAMGAGAGVNCYIEANSRDFTNFYLLSSQKGERAAVHWSLMGEHNALNAAAAVTAAGCIGIPLKIACQALCDFQGVARRMQFLGEWGGMRLYDDFAHHPSAIRASLHALRSHVGMDARIIAVMEPRSNTMKLGGHQDSLSDSFSEANQVFFYQSPEVSWDMEAATSKLADQRIVCHDTATLRGCVISALRPGDNILFMSNGGFGGLQQSVMDTLRATQRDSDAKKLGICHD
ncbi:MAG: UDP-N-acetylmuramate:L-alanyl-gamma-D-glutamyl-meso-diaminopimelate ligase [Candidatus Eutrophobiaceae bacterium]